MNDRQEIALQMYDKLRDIKIVEARIERSLELADMFIRKSREYKNAATHTAPNESNDIPSLWDRIQSAPNMPKNYSG